MTTSTFSPSPSTNPAPSRPAGAPADRVARAQQIRDAKTGRADLLGAQLRRPAALRLLCFALGLAVLALLAAASVAFGARGVSLHDVLAGFSGETETVAQAAVAKRVPRTILAMLIGAALAVAGTTMQAVTRNPIADPGILGVLSGAALAVVSGIAFLGISAPYARMGLAIAGAFITAVFVYIVGSLGPGGVTPLKLALAGAATSAGLSSIIAAVLLPRVDVMNEFRFWQIGGVGGASWDRLATVGPVLALGAAICLLSARGMNSLSLGDDVAVGLGNNVTRTRVGACIGAVILCGAATAIAGPIGFVGLVIPHVCRLIIGTDHRWLLPFCALAGAGLLVLADVVGRVLARPAEIEVGIITALIGAPFFIFIVRRQKVREL